MIKKRHPGATDHHTIRKADQLRQIVATLTHELKAPLNAILGSVSLLERRIPEGDLDRAHVDRLKRSSRHLLAMVEDVLEMSRVESGQLPLSLGARRLGPAIEEALADIETQATAHALTVTNAVSGASADLAYWGDERRVRQILVNLLTNAIKFTAAGGAVLVSGGAGKTATVYLRVQDTGRGIPANNLETIFEPFRQSDPSDQYRGSGLGLAISRQLARMMGGDLVAESDGFGSRFTLWLPIAPSEHETR
jgi:signal transduction histidine kinase